MKKIYFLLAALTLSATVMANSWRVCSQANQHAHFLSVADAVASESVLENDTLYIEPGHVELAACDISKKLHLIGPGYNYLANEINAMDIRNAAFPANINIRIAGTTISGCHIAGTVNCYASDVTISNCFLYCFYSVGSTSNVTIQDCFFNGSGSGFYGGIECNLPCTGWTIKNNVIWGHVSLYSSTNINFYNNTVVASTQNSYDYIISGVCSNSLFYNNIIINNGVNYGGCIVASPSNNNTISNNVLSCDPRSDYYNSVFNATAEGVLELDNVTSFEEKFRHLANGPAVGAGTNGVTCGAYGAVTGERPYTPAGIPQYRPYIIDSNISDTPSENNTVNASFKIKVQQ